MLLLDRWLTAFDTPCGHPATLQQMFFFTSKFSANRRDLRSKLWGQDINLSRQQGYRLSQWIRMELLPLQSSGPGIFPFWAWDMEHRETRWRWMWAARGLELGCVVRKYWAWLEINKVFCHAGFSGKIWHCSLQRRCCSVSNITMEMKKGLRVCCHHHYLSKENIITVIIIIRQ